MELSIRQMRSSEANFKYSIRKYFLEGLRPFGIPAVFDRRLQAPPTEKSDIWLAVTMENTAPNANIFERYMQLSCCAVRDIEFSKLSFVVDAVSRLLTDESLTDGLARIPLFVEGEHEKDAAIGHMLITDVYWHGEYDLENQIKVRPIRIRIWYAV